MITLNDEQSKKLEELVKPIIEFLNNFHPHIKIIITATNAEIVEGVKGYHTEEYSRD